MGIFDNVTAVASNLGGLGDLAGKAKLLSAVMGLMGGSGGGLGSLVQSLQAAGMADAVSSWIGGGQNLPVSAADIQTGLGSAKLQEFASQAGTTTEEASSTLASLLPGLIDKLTPDGQVPSGGGAPSLDLLKQLLG
jgi:uncharacterized protein YidB (DUF937 family)